MSDGKWVIINGRIDAPHQRQPFATFLAADKNKYVFVIEPNDYIRLDTQEILLLTNP